MKICHITSVHKSDDTRIFHKECVSLAKAGYEVYLVAQGDSFERDGVHIVGIGTPPASRLKRMTQTAKKVYKAALSLNADLYHFHDPELLPYGLKLKKQGKIVIFDSHENTLEQMDEKEWIPFMIRPLVSRLYCSYAVHAFKAYDAIVSPHVHTCQSVKPYNSVVRLITNYPFLSLLNKEKKTDTAKIRLGFAGGISAQWSHIQVLEAISKIDQVSYEAWGRLSPEYSSVLAQSAGYEQAIFHGAIPHNEVAANLVTLDIGIALCQYNKNTLGKLGNLANTKLFEYMSIGLPVICTDFTLWQEIVDKYHCGICVDPNDVGAIAEAIIYLRDHPKEAFEMGQNGRRAVEQEFNWGTQETILLDLYKKLLQI